MIFAGKATAVGAHAVTIEPDGGGEATVQSVAPDAVIKLNGDNAALQDLRAGDHVTLEGNPAIKVTVQREEALKERDAALLEEPVLQPHEAPSPWNARI